MSVERRQTERFDITIPVVVKAHCADGKHMKSKAITNNISRGGLYVELPWRVQEDKNTVLVLSLDPTSDFESFNGSVALLCSVKRVNQTRTGKWGVGLKILRHRLLQQSDDFDRTSFE